MQACQVKRSCDIDWVGDPINVVTGANSGFNLEFKLPGPLPLLWRRYYDSSKAHFHGSLGWGSAHEYDRCLQFDLDGLRYTSPVGKVIPFPPLYKDGDRFANGGLTLRRLRSDSFEITSAEGECAEFVLKSAAPAPIQRLRKGNAEIRFEYDSQDHLTAIIDSARRHIQVRCDYQGRVTELALTEGKGRQPRTLLTCVYDSKGDLIRGTDAYGNSFHLEYDSYHRVITRRDRRGYSFFFEYDEHGRCVRSRGEDGFLEVNLRYLPERVTLVTHADGGLWQYFYNEHGVLDRIIDPYGGTRLFKLDAKGRIASECDPNGNLRKWIYSVTGAKLGKLSSLGVFSTDPDGPATPDQAPSAIASSALEWLYGQLLNNKRLDLPRPEDPALAGLNGLGKIIRTADQFQEPREKHDLGLLIGETGLYGSARRWVYDAVGNIQRFHDHDGCMYRYEYESYDLRVREIDPLGNAITYSYTKSGQIASITDAGGTRSEYSYDLADRLSAVSRHGALKESYRYDRAGNLTEKLGSDGRPLVTFEIGPNNQKTTRNLASGEKHSFRYTKDGRYAALSTGKHETEFAYDGFGNRIKDECDGLGVEHRFSARNRLASTRIFKNFTIQYRRESQDTLHLTDPAGNKHEIQFLGSGLVQRTHFNRTSELTQFDPDGRCLVQAVISAKQPTRRWLRQYSYSGEGDLLSVEDNLRGTTSYEYDQAHRLARSIRGQVADRFRFDSAGNLIEQPGLWGVLVRDGNRLLTASGKEFDYDDRNAVVSQQSATGKTRFFYDSRDMLVRCEVNGREWKAEYDPLRRRLNKSYGQSRTEFFWDSDRLAAERHEDGRIRIYVYADHFSLTPLIFLDYASIDADPRSGAAYVVFANHLGTPVRVEDKYGEAVWRAEIEPYGLAHIDPSACITMPLRFPGHYFDGELQLHYNRFRYYSPLLGRYLQSDPIGIAGGVNLYAYTVNPLKEVDVRGDCPAKAKAKKGAGAADDGGDAESMPIRNKALAGDVHPVTGVPFDENGFPVFDAVADVDIPPELFKESDYKQFKAATLALNEALQRSPEAMQDFTDEQLSQIAKGETPDGYTWHHNQDDGRMQLVDEDTHAKTGHTGGDSIWGNRT